MKDLDKIAMHSLYTSTVAQMTIEYSWNVFSRFVGNGSRRILELGPAEGLMTRKMVEAGHTVLAIDGSKIYAEALDGVAGVRCIHGYFEEVELDDEFDVIILGHVLEHVDDPSKVLKRCKNWLASKGRIMGAVPNRNSLHRQMAVEMQIIDRLDQMSDKDRHHGHQRHYSMGMLVDEFVGAGFSVIDKGGYWLKMLPDKQLEEQWSKEQLIASFSVGERLPEDAAEIWVVAE